MGFGIRVPGVRISTRGVRVGPRFANVGVSTRGRVSASAGPRLARVSASPRGIRVGTGLGPVRVSGGSGGIRVGGGVGPVFGSVGRSGLVLGVGAGPIWVANRVGGKVSNNSQSSSPRMAMSKEYESYKNELAASGGSRRTREELRIAGINALLSQMNYMFAPFADFTTPIPEFPDVAKLNEWATNRAIQFLIDSGEITDPLQEIPARATRDTVITEARRNLERQSIFKPVHPAYSIDIQQESMPNIEEIFNWALAEIHSSTTLLQRIVHRRKIRESAQTKAAEKQTQLFADIEQWDQDLRKYQNQIDDESERLIKFYDTQRQRLIDAQQPIQDRIKQETLRIHAFQKDALEYINEIYQHFLLGDPVLTTIVLQTVMADNEGSAAPVGIDDGDLLVLMTAPSVSDVIWPEKIEVNNYISVKKKKKADLNLDYFMFLFCHTVATAREAFATSKQIDRVRILVLDESDQEKEFLQRRLAAILNLSRSDLKNFPTDAISNIKSKAALKAVNDWQNALSSGNPFQVIQQAEQFQSGQMSVITDCMQYFIGALEPLTSNFLSHTDIAPSKRPRLIDFTDSKVTTSDSIQILVNTEPDIMQSLDVPVEFVSRPDFWILCGLLADQWDKAEVDVEELKFRASEIASCLYRFEDSDVNWPRRSGL